MDRMIEIIEGQEYRPEAIVPTLNLDVVVDLFQLTPGSASHGNRRAHMLMTGQMEVAPGTAQEFQTSATFDDINVARAFALRELQQFKAFFIVRPEFNESVLPFVPAQAEKVAA